MKQLVLLFGFLTLSVSIYAQNPIDTFWHLKPFSNKGNSGIGFAEAENMMKGKVPQKVIVAIADAGVDINHPDLKDMLWTNINEKAGNNIDDDGNGYIDDIYGWNFIGETIYDNLEITRQYVILNKKYELKPETTIADKDEFARYLKIKEIYLAKNLESKLFFDFFLEAKTGLESLENSYGTDITKEEILNHKSQNRSEEIARDILAGVTKTGKAFNYLPFRKELIAAYEQYDRAYNYNYNADFDPRAKMVGDNYEDTNERYYGNNSVFYGEHSSHGTHVAGIVAANSTNNIGAKGICQSCRIMSIRNVPEGDERDKDVANSIRYAVDNGAKIVNMSFGKSYAHNATVVYEAIKYAESKNVLLVHAAGNDGKDNDLSDNFPNDNHDAFNNWLEVGASSWKKGTHKLADFSNYGASQVDVFAPGVAIYSTTPDGGYEAFDGTSMASPVAAGVAAYVWSYYPSLSAAQLKQVLMKSALPIKGRVKKPGSKRKTRACKLSKTGGEINLPAALKMAESITK
ncbi:MAG: peptidase S8 [Bacteroidetes bacterium]|nr:MAG: peptidase S8 [Bacteroidota bacterium]